MPQHSREDWARFDPSSIPTKTDRGPLEEWLGQTPGDGRKILDLGCGVGEVSLRIVERGFSVVGCDINEDALERAWKSVPSGVFHRRDVAAAEGLHLAEAPFDLVVCQLVISIVGGPEERRNLVRNAWNALSPAGRLYLSASGVSDDINPAYARLYAEDYPITGERYTYCSRDASGRVLYDTHHFTEEELRLHLEQAGFEEIEIRNKNETSSRRPNEPARFLYAFCRKPSSS